METYEATVALPMAHVMAATAALRGDLRAQILGDGSAVADWTTFQVTAPVEEFDAEGRIVYRYRATVQADSLDDLFHPMPAIA